MDRRRRLGGHLDVRLLSDGGRYRSAVARRGAKPASLENNRVQRPASHPVSHALRLSPVLPALLYRPAVLLRAGAVLPVLRTWLRAMVVTADSKARFNSPSWPGFVSAMTR